MKTTEEKNRMIAEFMGCENRNDYFRVEEFSRIILQISELKYHSSWEWLMSVVEKIETIQLPNPSIIPVTVEIKGNSCRIFKGEWNESKEGSISCVSYKGNQIQYTKQEATYNAVVKFIEWYNENK